ncbi:MAG: ferrous iron transport protein A [Deltaproteobacteria bacterium]|nr:ferrous iron transport protein A [Deltaproteobacteria bacterium]
MAPIPLSMVREGKRVQVVEIRAGRGLMRRLLGIGIGLGDVIEVISNSAPGQVIIGKGEMRIGLGFGMAHKILVLQA